MPRSGRSSACNEAARTLVYGDRQRAYGKARENHERIAKVWEAVLGVPIVCLTEWSSVMQERGELAAESESGVVMGGRW
ncbi:MAG: hypothetical protein KIT11_05440 [Fimbriimonadaceae bacterium]|nr:hypothetical protein [Fimbriimonadaceae bacterium]QYK56664.1 MAG: hypothetical protein KF733_04080 [Fimbriimonadaceae bacterium]